MPLSFGAIDWPDADAEQCLRRGGSKAGTNAYLRMKGGFDEHLPTSTVDIAPSEEVERRIEGMTFDREKIVRAYHPLDMFGMVDVLKTERNLRGTREVRHAIAEVLAHARRPDVRSFVEYEFGQPFDGNVGILVQDCCGDICGSILEHPHERGIYRIGLVTPAIIGKEVREEELCVADGRRLDKRAFLHGHVEYEESAIKRIEEIVTLYRRIIDAGLMPSTHSWQMEFGIDDVTNQIRFYQARLFKVFAPPASFEPDILRTKRSEDVHLVWPYDCYGSTPEEGISIPISFLDEEGVYRTRNKNRAAYVFANRKDHETTPLSLQPANFHAYVPCSGQQQLLPHGHYRWMQKAELTMGISTNSDFNALVRRGSLQSVRLVSNGIRGFISHRKKQL